MRVNAVRYLQTQGAWDGSVWRAYIPGRLVRIDRWRRRLLEMKAKTIRKAMSLV